jgi:hypothetical protein
MRSLLVISALTLLSACVDEPTPKQADKAAAATDDGDEQESVKAQQRSIEEAADEAVKLIEADAKAEIDQLSAQAEQDR